MDEIDEVGVREWFFQKVDCAKTGHPLAMGGKGIARPDNGACIWMAGPQIVKEILPQIGNSIYVENEKVRPIVHHEALGFFEATGKIDLGGRRGFPKRGENFRSEVFFGFEHKDAPALLERVLGM